MNKRSRDVYEENELEECTKRVRMIDNASIGKKRSMALEEYIPNKRVKFEPVVTHELKAEEYRKVIIRLYKMNMRMNSKINFLKHESDYHKNKFKELEERVINKGIFSRKLTMPNGDMPRLQEVI